MLQSIRERLTGPGLGHSRNPDDSVRLCRGERLLLSSGSGNQVALVNDQEITFNDFNQSFLELPPPHAAAQMGEAFDAAEVR